MARAKGDDAPAHAIVLGPAAWFIVLSGLVVPALFPALVGLGFLLFAQRGPILADRLEHAGHGGAAALVRLVHMVENR